MLASELIEETRRLLFTGQREERNKLATSIGTPDTSLTMSYPLQSINRGAKLSIDLEDIYVWGTANLTVSPVDRGQWGSVAAPHTAGAVAHVNPKFSNWEIFSAINDEIQSLSSPTNGLYHVITQELTYNPSVQGYTYASSNLIEIMEVRYAVPGPSNEYPISRDWELARDMSDEFAGGVALFIRDAFPNRTVLVKGKFSFSPMAANMAADTLFSNIPTNILDIIPIGAAWRLSTPREIRRNFDEVQGDTRRADEVPPGANLGGARELGRLRQQRINEEVARLSVMYPKHSPRHPYYIS